jgi:hypothetical protein
MSLTPSFEYLGSKKKVTMYIFFSGKKDLPVHPMIN